MSTYSAQSLVQQVTVRQKLGGTPCSIQELNEQAMQRGGVQLPLCSLLIGKAVAAEQSGVQEVQHALLASLVHAPLGPLCSSKKNGVSRVLVEPLQQNLHISGRLKGGMRWV